MLRETGAENYPWNLNQVMLAEEVRDGKTWIYNVLRHLIPFIACPSKKDTTMSLPMRWALAAALGLIALPAAAQDKPTLTIYTYDSFAAEWGPGPGLKSGFEAQCDCTVDFVSTDTSIGALRRVQLEGDTTDADIVLGLDTGVVAEARKTELFAEHGVDTSHLDIPTGWSADDFVPFDYGYFAFVYDTRSIDEPPRSFTELAARDDDFKIAIQDPRSATPGLGLMLWVKQAYGDRATEVWGDLAPNILTVTRGWSEAYNLFLEGEADMVLSYTTSPAYHVIAENEDRYAAAKFEEGHYMQIEVAGMLKSSEHPELARDFLAYLVSPEGQKGIPTTNWMYPAANIELPEPFGNLVEVDKPLLMDPETVGDNTDAWIEEMLGAIQ